MAKTDDPMPTRMGEEMARWLARHSKHSERVFHGGNPGAGTIVRPSRTVDRWLATGAKQLPNKETE
jgi:hypothetical protein